MKYFIPILIITFIFGCSSDVDKAALENKEERVFNPNKTYVITSPIEGTLVKNGKPLANKVIKRKLKWFGNEAGIVQTFSTDEKGHFSLPAHEAKLKLGMLTQFVAKTYLDLELDGELLPIWYSAKYDEEMYSELSPSKEPISNLVCDLEAEEIGASGEDGSSANILTICRWDGIKIIR